MHDEMNGQTLNQTEGNPVSSGELHAASEELHVLGADSLDLVAGGPHGTIVVIG